METTVSRRAWIGSMLAWGAWPSHRLDARSPLPRTTAMSQQQDPFWERIRAQFEISPDLVNQVTVVRGVTPKAVRTALADETERLNTFRGATSGRTRPESRSRAAARAGAASIIGARPEEVALLRNTTEGVTTVLRNWPLERGDEILTSSAEHGPFYDVLAQRAARDGIVVRRFHYPAPVSSYEEILEAIDRAMSPRTRLVMIGHVVLTGQINPVRRIADLVHDRGGLLLVDGVLGVGQVETNVEAMDCDFYAAGFHKWGSGPRATAVFYVRPELVGMLPPLFGAYVESPEDGFFRPSSDDPRMVKYETFGAHPDAHFLVLAEAIDFLQGIGIRRIRERLFELTSRWTARVEELDRFRSAVRIHPDHCAGLVAWELEGVDTEDVRPVLAQHRVLVGRTESYAGFFGIPKDRPRRLFTANSGVFTSEDDVDRLAEAIEAAATRLG